MNPPFSRNRMKTVPMRLARRWNWALVFVLHGFAGLLPEHPEYVPEENKNTTDGDNAHDDNQAFDVHVSSPLAIETMSPAV